MAQWVQHKSGIGEKWEVTTTVTSIDWAVKAKVDGVVHHLPKSEYMPCEPPTPPKRWVDVTAECEVASSGITLVHAKCHVVSGGVNGYRLRKVEFGVRGQWGFIVEKKEQP